MMQHFHHCIPDVLLHILLARDIAQHFCEGFMTPSIFRAKQNWFTGHSAIVCVAELNELAF